MRELTTKEKKAFLIVNRLSYYGDESIGLLSDLIKDLILNDEIEYCENKIISSYPHLLKDGDEENNFYFDDSGYINHRIIRKWELENE